MDRPPRSPKEPMLSKKLLVRAFLWYGMIESVVAMLAYFFLNFTHGWPATPLAGTGVVYRMATTITFAAIVFSQIGMVFNCRTDRTSLFKVGLFSNRMILVGIACELILLCLLMYVPFFHSLFNTAPLELGDWGFLLIWPPVIILIEELRKAGIRRREQRMKRNKC
jgi:magnesium-transporting ATPase (P-type)